MTSPSPASTVPLVKAYLVAQISASTLLPATLLGGPVLVCYGEPGTNLPQAVIAVGSVVNAQVTPWLMVGSGGGGWLDERYSLEVQIEAFTGDDDPQTCDEAALTLWQVVCAAVRADPSCGGLVIEARPLQWQSDSGWTDSHQGRLCRLTGEIEVHAQI